MGGCVSREGITADLEAFKQAGLGGAFIFHVGQLPIDSPVKFRSDEWWSRRQARGQPHGVFRSFCSLN
jgi:hypothetical protein